MQLGDPHPLCGQDASVQDERWADVQRPLPPAGGADTQRPQEHAVVKGAEHCILAVTAATVWHWHLPGVVLSLAGAFALEHASACAGLTSSSAAAGGCWAAWRAH